MHELHGRLSALATFVKNGGHKPVVLTLLAPPKCGKSPHFTIVPPSIIAWPGSSALAINWAGGEGFTRETDIEKY
jgi:hypothetical protein